MDTEKRLFKDQAEFDSWLASLAHQIGVEPDMPFSELLTFEHFFGLHLLDTTGEPLLNREANWIAPYPITSIPFRYRYREGWNSEYIPKSFPCVALPWFELRGNLSIATVRFVYPTDFQVD